MMNRFCRAIALSLVGLMAVSHQSTSAQTLDPNESVCYLRMQSGRVVNLQPLCGKVPASSTQARPASRVQAPVPANSRRQLNDFDESDDDRPQPTFPSRLLTPIPATGIRTFPGATASPVQPRPAPARTTPQTPVLVVPQRQPDPDYEDGRF